MAGSLKLPFSDLGKPSANVSGESPIDCHAGHMVVWMPEPLKIGFRFTHTLEGCRIAGLHIDTVDVPRIVVHRVPPPAVSLFHTSILNVREDADWGLTSRRSFSLAMMLAAWFFPKALSASSGLPNLAQIAWSLSPLAFYLCGRPAARTGRLRAVCLGRPRARPLTVPHR